MGIACLKIITFHVLLSGCYVFSHTHSSMMSPVEKNQKLKRPANKQHLNDSIDLQNSDSIWVKSEGNGIRHVAICQILARVCGLPKLEVVYLNQD